MTSPSQTPTLAEVLREAIREDRRELHTSIPGVIDSWDKKTGLADIKVGLKTFAPQEDGTMKARSYAILLSVPVAIPGGGKYRMSFPLKKDDPVEVHFQEASIDIWLDKGGADVDPQDRRRHNISDPIAVPGPRPKDQRWKTMSDDDASFGLDDGDNQFIAKKNGELWLGSKDGGADLTEKGVLGSTQKQDLNTMLQSAAQACTTAASACTTAVAALTIVTTAVASGAAGLSVPPLTPVGVLFQALNTGLIALTSQLSNIGAQFTAMNSAFTQLRTALDNHLSGVVKLK